MWKKLIAMASMAAILISPLESARGYAEAKNIIVTPFQGQWKYYGQKRTFLLNEHYTLSDETVIRPSGWSLGVEKEDMGNWKYVINQPEGSTDNFVLAENAPTFEIRKYRTDAEAVIRSDNPSGSAYTSKDSVTMEAPEGYRISSRLSLADEDWLEELESGPLQEGSNFRVYYLRSYLQDETKYAIDWVPKVVYFDVDTIAPQIQDLRMASESDVEAEASISMTDNGSDQSAMYYYMVVPKDYSQADTITNAFVEEYIKAGNGIGGVGRVSREKPAVLSFGGLTPKTEYQIYAFLRDDAGNESEMRISDVFTTDNLALQGEVSVEGEAELGGTLTAKPQLTSDGAGKLSYQWYRVKLTEDKEPFNEAYDKTGGAAEDVLEAVDDEEEDDDEEEGDDEEEDAEDEEETAGGLLNASRQSTSAADDIEMEDNAEEIEGAVSASYQVSRADIGYRLMVRVTAENYSGSVWGSTTSFIPKLIPAYTLPTINASLYSPARQLSGIRLPGQWSWVDSSIVPVYGNSGYRARFVPADTSLYRTVIVRINVPIKKKTLRRSMVKVSKRVAYAGRAIKNNFTVRDQKKLISSKNYEAAYENNKNPGKAVVVLEGRGNYKGIVSFSYQIVKKSVKRCSVLYNKKRAYNGKKRSANVILKNGRITMKKGRDFTLAYKNHTEVGRAAVTIQGKGKYKGKRTLYFSIVPAVPLIKKITRANRYLRLYFSKDKTVKGYHVELSKTRSFNRKKTWKYLTTGDSLGIRRMEKGIWYMRVAAYSVKDGEIYKSAYTKTRKINIK